MTTVKGTVDLGNNPQKALHVFLPLALITVLYSINSIRMARRHYCTACSTTDWKIRPDMILIHRQQSFLHITSCSSIPVRFSFFHFHWRGFKVHIIFFHTVTFQLCIVATWCFKSVNKAIPARPHFLKWIFWMDTFHTVPKRHCNRVLSIPC